MVPAFHRFTCSGFAPHAVLSPVNPSSWKMRVPTLMHKNWKKSRHINSKITQYVDLLAMPRSRSYRLHSEYTRRGEMQPCASHGDSLVE